MSNNLTKYNILSFFLVFVFVFLRFCVVICVQLITPYATSSSCLPHCEQKELLGALKKPHPEVQHRLTKRDASSSCSFASRASAVQADNCSF